MKCTSISTGSSSGDNLTLEQFTESEHAGTPLGELFVALTGEAVWSSDYTIYASFDGRRPFLQVNHRTFLSEGSLVIYNDGKTVLSVRGVEDAVRALIHDSRKALQSSISLLQYRRNDLERLSDKIMWDKARAAIVAAFPQAADATPSNVGSEVDLYAFANKGMGPIFVARAVGGEFIGGTACVWRNSFEWFSAGDGIKEGQRHYLFWEALARTFVRSELDVSEEDLRHANVFASENPWDDQRLERFTLEKAVFRVPSKIPKNIRDDTFVVVEFGSDNLPARTFIQEQSAIET